MFTNKGITRELFETMILDLIRLPKSIVASDPYCLELCVELENNAGPLYLFFVYNPYDIDHTLYRAMATYAYMVQQNNNGGYIPVHEQDGKRFCEVNGREGYDSFILGDTVKFAYNYDYACTGEVVGVCAGFVLVKIIDGQGLYEEGELIDLSLEF